MTELVSVVMSVYNADVYHLKRSIDSILGQTYSNLEFIIINDGADADCIKYIESVGDSRIKLIHNAHNIGLAASLNKGIEIAQGKYIARMDADDYSLPERISEQVKYMEEHENVDVLSCISLDIMNGKICGGIGGAYSKFDNEDIRIELSLAPKTFPHPAVMFRTEFLKLHKLKYDEKFMRAQDYDMWARCSLYGTLDSLQEPLLLYDKGDDISDRPSEKQVYYSNLTKLKCLKRLLPDATGNQQELYIHMRDMDMTGNVADNLLLVRELVNANKRLRVYDRHKYSSIIYFWWGRKMMYPENRLYLGGFLRHPLFIIHVICAYIERFPRHLLQKRYEKKMLYKFQKDVQVRIGEKLA
ncbi:glycosyltransferase family 2 protein [Butyrivibrio sp. YAB3001]|uniref:glycosyltransferase family 2 protein n=1 Tax=Butyrivibrio sp. YAB3001 TaxID=1520812 RepID=UPI0008F674FC|nr:glycosyltransferase [Butyrivibrio sp. YAB3001]SFC74701.1 Glycosyl transferase family 2 [Butyrivibrio sp. YAB3001]